MANRQDLRPDNCPEWYDGKYVNEPGFCDEFLEEHPMLCIGGKLVGLSGVIESEAQVKQLIAEKLDPFLGSGLAKKCGSILDYIKIRAHSEPLPLELDRIHFQNGVYRIGGEFEAKIEFCNNRLAIGYDADARPPERWMKFLHELLDDDDILTLQEFMGYCLIPSTKAQKMLVIIGKGGEGKSRIGLILMKILGNSMNVGSIQKVETSAFARADLQNKLLLVDDDMDMNALPKTNYIKAIVTAEGRMDLERKGEQSYQARLYCRLMGFSNGSLNALYDQSDGFHRRQLILQAKERPADREDDPYLVEKLEEELPGIVLWCIEGLERLLRNNYRFTIGKRTRDNMKELRKSNDNVLEFMESDGYIAFDPGKTVSSKLLYDAYVLFCEDNAYKPYSATRLSQEMAQHAKRLGIEPTNNIHLPGGKRVRGFKGIEAIRGAYLPPIR